MPKESVLVTLYATPNPRSLKGVTFSIARKLTAFASTSASKFLHQTTLICVYCVFYTHWHYNKYTLVVGKLSFKF